MPIDIFIDVDSSSDPNMNLKSPSNTSTQNKLIKYVNSPPQMNNLEARIKQRQSAMARGLAEEVGNKNPGTNTATADQKRGFTEMPS